MAGSLGAFASKRGKSARSSTARVRASFLLLKVTTTARLGSALTKTKCTSSVTARASAWAAVMTQDDSHCTSGMTSTEGAATMHLVLKMNSCPVKRSLSVWKWKYGRLNDNL